jgi:hypothetical protein
MGGNRGYKVVTLRPIKFQWVGGRISTVLLYAFTYTRSRANSVPSYVTLNLKRASQFVTIAYVREYLYFEIKQSYFSDTKPTIPSFNFREG